MAQRMAGKRVALAGPRKAEEMALLVVKMGVSQYSARPRVPFSGRYRAAQRCCIVGEAPSGLVHLHDRYGAGCPVRYGRGYGRG